MKRFIIYILIFSLAPFTNLKGQNAHFSQFYSNPLYLAPSFAGSSENSRFILNFREQWAKLPGNFTSYSFSADHFFSDFNSGMGLLFFTDQAGGGKLTTTTIGYLYSYKIKVNDELFIQPGLSAYYYNRNVNYSKLSFADQYFNGEFVGTTSEMLPPEVVQHADFAVSALAYTENFWGGFNLNHLMSLSPVLKDDYKYADLHFSLYGGARIVTKRTVQNRSNNVLHLAFNFRRQSMVNQLDIGGYYYRNPIYIGLWYRGLPISNTHPSSDALIFLIGAKYNNLVLSYSYDMSLGYLIASTGGSHEISLIYNLPQIKGYIGSRKKNRKIPCPDFQ